MRSRSQGGHQAAAAFGWVALGFSLALALGLGKATTAHANGPALVGESPRSVDRRAFDEAVDLVLNDYVEPVQAPKVFGRALSHMVAGLDAHSVYLDAAERTRWNAMRQRGLTTGMHLRATQGRDAHLEIVAVMPGSAADKAGLKVGDVVLSIASRSGYSFEHALLAQIAATPVDGGRVAVEVRSPDGAQRTVELNATRVDSVAVVEPALIIPGPEVQPKVRAKQIARISVHAFLPGVAEQVRRELAELHRAAGGRLDGLVLDLRGNPGGDVQEALRVAELFVDEGVLVRTRGRDHSILSEERAHRAGSDTELPIAIVQDENSASAAELLAAALHAHGRATILGRTSHGKGTVQRLFGLPDGAQLRLSVARYFGPDDRQIDGRGVVPDIPLAPDEMEAANAHAWAYLAGNRPSSTPSN